MDAVTTTNDLNLPAETACEQSTVDVYANNKLFFYIKACFQIKDYVVHNSDLLDFVKSMYSIT